MPSIDEILKRFRCTSLTVDRLAADIKDFEVSLNRYKKDPPGKKDQVSAWIDGCDAHLTNAKKALEECDMASGYQSLLNAEREAIPIMPDEERAARVLSLRNEIDSKLVDSWRGKSSQSLLSGKPEEVPVEAIREALFHRNTHSQNMYRKIELLRRQLIFIGTLLVILLLVAVSVSALGDLTVFDNPSLSNLFLFAIFMGVLGGTLSAAISVTDTDPSARIPDVQRTRLITLARSALGGAASIPVFLLIQGNVIQLMATPFTPWAVLFFCFLAGFSERWFLGTLETFVKNRGANGETDKD